MRVVVVGKHRSHWVQQAEQGHWNSDQPQEDQGDRDQRRYPDSERQKQITHGSETTP